MTLMALNTRGLFDPRWAYFARPVAVSGMLAKVEVRRPRKVDDWNPAQGDVFDGSLDTSVLCYRGRARVQPNNDWRARKQRWDGENVTEYACRIQLDLTGNEVTNPTSLPDNTIPTDAGVLEVNDQVRVVGVFEPYGEPIDSLIMEYTYIVRNISASSNSWVRTLLCDFIANATT